MHSEKKRGKTSYAGAGGEPAEFYQALGRYRIALPVNKGYLYLNPDEIIRLSVATSGTWSIKNILTA